MCNCAKGIRFTKLDSYAFAHFRMKPNAAGLVRWMGVNWRGLPFPLRLWFLFRVLLRGHTINVAESLDQFGGCGCIDRLKIYLEKYAPLV